MRVVLWPVVRSGITLYNAVLTFGPVFDAADEPPMKCSINIQMKDTKQYPNKKWIYDILGLHLVKVSCHFSITKFFITNQNLISHSTP